MTFGDRSARTHHECDRGARGGCSHIVSLLAMLVGVVASTAFAEQYTDSFDSSGVTWELPPSAPSDLLREHRRQSGEVHRGKAAEFFRFESQTRQPAFGFTHELPSTPVFNELTASLWVKANRPGVAMWLQIRCPQAIDPASKRPLIFRLAGDTYESAGQWQRLTCVTSDAAIRSRLTSLRAQLIAAGADRSINLNDMRVEAVELRTSLAPGMTAVVVDDLDFGPLVDMARPAEVATVPTTGPKKAVPLDVSGGHIRLHKRPFVPRMVSYHGEPVDLLRKLGINVVWLDKARAVTGLASEEADTGLVDALRNAGLWVAATPPTNAAIAGLSPNSPAAITDTEAIQTTSYSQSAPATIGRGSESVLFWNLGVRVPASDFEDVKASAEAIRQSDQLYDRPRPVIADVTSRDRSFSRRLDSTGSSLPLLHMPRTPSQYYLELQRRLQMTLAGSPKMTWIATEPSPAVRAATRDATREAVVEPEQILMQADLALAAGYQWINFWTRTPLDGDGAGDAERRAAIEIANRRLSLLEPWIATGECLGRATVTVGEPTARPVQYPILATVHRSQYGLLVRVMWVDEHGQFVPGPMRADNVRVLVRGAGELSQAYSVSLTRVAPLDARVTAGGTEITLPSLDQSATILITGIDGRIDGLKREVVSKRAGAADAWVRLARAKLDRVRQTHDAIEAVSQRPIRSGSTLIAEADVRTDQAEDALTANDFEAARHYAGLSLQLLRKLQRDHWDAAVRALSTPHTSLHAVCFETLPDYWSERGRLSTDLSETFDVPGGQFEETSTMTAAGWQTTSVTEARVDIVACDRESGRSLRLAAAEASDLMPETVRASVESPEFTAAPGDVIVLTAKVRAYDGRKPGVIRISDTHFGPALGVQRTAPIGRWETVQLMRKANDSGVVRFSFDLLSSGVVCVDDVTTTIVRSPVEDLAIAPEPSEDDDHSGFLRNPLKLARPLELLPSLPSLPKLPTWGRDRDEGPPAAELPEIEPATGESPEETPLELPTIRPGHSP